MDKNILDILSKIDINKIDYVQQNRKFTLFYNLDILNELSALKCELC